MRSDIVKKGPTRCAHRSLFHALGYSPEDLKKPLIAAFIGCGITGIYLAFAQVKIYSFGAPGFFTMANFIDPSGADPTNFYRAIGGAVVSIVSTFIATWALGFDESDISDEVEAKK